MYKCPQCQNTTDEWYYTKGRRDSMCKSCRKAYRKDEKRIYTAQYIADHYDEQKERMEQWRQDNKDYQRKWSKHCPESQLLRSARQRAKLKGVPCTITQEHIIIPQVCPVFKVPLQKNTPFAPSLDRFIPELGYVPGNVYVISRKANAMKSNGTLTDVKMLLEWMQSHTNPSISS